MPYVLPQPTPAEVAPYVFYDNFLTELECYTLIDLAKRLPPAPALVGGKTDVDGTNKEKRRSELFWINWEHQHEWLFKKMSDSIFLANNKWWGYHLSGINEALQLTHYKSEDLGHYDWHEDHGDQPGFLHRKLSMVILLNDSFEGGQFEFYHTGAPKEFKKGSMILFPSFKTHRVLPVTSGERWSLVSWINGPPFC